MTSYPSGRRALILGGSCELGIGLAGVMVAKGLHPILTHRDDTGKNRIDTSLEEVSGKYTCCHLDLDDADTLTLLEKVLAQGVDYLVDLAQGDMEGLVAAADRSAMTAYFEANIIRRTNVIQQVSRSMIAQRKGRMVYISSAAAARPNPGQGFYAAVKQASEALYRNIGLELAPRGITTATLRLGYVDAGRGQRFLEINSERALAKVPLGRALEANEVVDTIMFLLSDSAEGFNATILTMDGGLSTGK